MALSVRYNANVKNKRPAFSDEDHDEDSAGYDTDNTYESIHFIPNKTPQVVPYQCVDIKRIINQRQNFDSRPRDVVVNDELARHGDNLLRGYKYEFWRKSNEVGSMNNSRPQSLNLRQKQIINGVKAENMYNAKLSCRNDRVYSKCGPVRGEIIEKNTKNKPQVELYGRHFGLVGTIPDKVDNEDAIYGFTSERYGFGEILYKPNTEFYHSAVERNRDLLERYGYDVNDTDYVMNDPREAVNDVDRNGCEFGGNETDNTYESINIQTDPNEKVESAHDSSSGIASDVASYYPQTNMSTFKGDATGSDKTSEDSGRKSVSWASNLDSPRSSNHYVQMHISKQRQSPSSPLSYKHKQSMYNTSRYSDSHVDKLEQKLSALNLPPENGKITTHTKGKLPKPSSFDHLPDDVVLKIFSYLPSDHLCRCSRVSRRWYEFVWEPFLWTKIVINNSVIDIDKAIRILTKRLSYNTPYVCVILERVNLNGCEMLTDKGLHTIAKRCPELRHLQLQGCHNISNMAVFELVSNCVNLEHLDLSGCPSVTCISLLDGGLSHGTPRHQQQIYLRYLDMTDCYALDDDGLGVIAMHCSQLQFLYLRRCVQLTDESMQYLANYCSTLRELSVSDCRNITDLGLRDLSKLGDNLRYLSVAKCDRMSDVGVRYLAKFCSKLRYLNVRGCEGVSDESLELLSASCPRLRSLDVGKCDITDIGLVVLSQNCPQLRKLSLKSCDSITDKGVVQLGYNCRGLQQLNIQDCNISVEGYKRVKRYCRRCIIEHTNPAFY